MSSIPKLFVFNSNTSKSVILLRSKFKCSWEMISWDRKNDIFIRGQWLCKKTIWPGGCSISPDGSMFKYHYEDSTGDYIVTSKVLNFTAEEIKKPKCGRWFVEQFENGIKPGPCNVPNGYEFIAGAIIKNGSVIADFNCDVFINVKPI